MRGEAAARACCGAPTSSSPAWLGILSRSPKYSSKPDPLYSFPADSPIKVQEPMSAIPNGDPVTTWKPLVVCPQPSTSQRLASALREFGTDPGAIISDYPRMGTIAALAVQQQANICFLDVST